MVYLLPNFFYLLPNFIYLLPNFNILLRHLFNLLPLLSEAAIYLMYQIIDFQFEPKQLICGTKQCGYGCNIETGDSGLQEYELPLRSRLGVAKYVESFDGVGLIPLKDFVSNESPPPLHLGFAA